MEESINSEKLDKMEGMDAVIAIVRARGDDLRLIVWESEDDKGYHIFKVCFDRRQSPLEDHRPPPLSLPARVEVDSEQH